MKRAQFIRIFFWFFVIVLSQSLFSTARYSMTVVDTGLHDQLIYDRFFKLATQAGFDITYYGLADLIDQREDLFGEDQNCSCMIVLLEDAFLAQQDQSILSKKILELIEKQSKKSKTVTYFMVPSQHQLTMKKSKQSPFLAYNKLLKPFGIFFNAMGNIESIVMHQAQGIDFIGLAYQVKIQQQFKNPFAWAGPYATSLQAISDESLKVGLHIKGDSMGILLPILQKDRRLFLGNSLVASYSSITENFRLFPLKKVKQKKIEEDIFAGLCYLYKTVDEMQSGLIAQNTSLKKLDYSQLNSKDQVKPLKNKKVLAWMELDVFGDKKLKIEQGRIIDAIIDGKINGLWLSIGPNQYFSIRAKFANRLELLKSSIARFSQQLKKACAKNKREIPPIFISFEITNNFVDKNLHPQESMVDLYGIEYPDVPAPLDRSWWQEEVIDSAQKFITFWNKHAKKLSISGFFIDLEMYLRSETGCGEFPGNAIGSKADFSFAKTESSSVEALVNDLVEQKKIKAFYEHLTKQAEDLGKWLKVSLQKIVPRATLSCYAANVSIDWFYQGLYKGISSKDDPMTLCSFTTHFNDFKSACEEKKMYVDYYAVLMLSHMQKEADFGLFSRLLKNNDGVWLNKLSRLSFPYQPQEWHKAEQTPLNFDGRKKLLDFIAKNR